MTEWIKCTEKMPKDSQRVLAWSTLGHSYAVYDYGMDRAKGRRWWSISGVGFEANAVSHWMPLPDPPIEYQPKC